MSYEPIDFPPLKNDLLLRAAKGFTYIPLLYFLY